MSVGCIDERSVWAILKGFFKDVGNRPYQVTLQMRLGRLGQTWKCRCDGRSVVLDFAEQRLSLVLSRGGQQNSAARQGEAGFSAPIRLCPTTPTPHPFSMQASPPS